MFEKAALAGWPFCCGYTGVERPLCGTFQAFGVRALMSGLVNRTTKDHF
ncbi:hypothetical protein Z946_2084 [Sulfitobacter noctilucicola]|nr:hypothetical protein Z946_2084 [Sulfitobacter noctilucicola]